MGMVGGLDLHRRQITFDVVEVESGEEWRGRVWQPDRDRFRRWLRDDVHPSSEWRPGGVGGGGLHRLAVCRRGDRGGRVRSAPGGAGRHPGGAGSQASRQDRSQRRSVAARSARGRRAARELDPARAGVGVARTGAAVRVVGEPAHGVVSTHPRRAVSPRRRGPGRRDPHAQDAGDARRRDAASCRRRRGSGSQSGIG